jgi:hypothetical protein
MKLHSQTKLRVIKNGAQRTLFSENSIAGSTSRNRDIMLVICRRHIVATQPSLRRIRAAGRERRG